MDDKTPLRGTLISRGLENKINILARTLGEERIRRDVDLSEYLETHLGGLAKAFYIATTTRELVRVVQLCRELKLKYLVIGSGSKIAISENGLLGIALKNRSDNLKIFGIKGKVSRVGLGIEEALVEADSGTSLKRLAEYVNQQGLGGFETLQLAGTIGGSLGILPVLREKTHQVNVLTVTGAVKNKQLSQLIKDDVILSVVFKLKARKS